MSHWVRLWSDMPTDPKWRVIARRAGRPLSEVIAVFVFMMTNAGANATERGELFNWQDDDVAAALDMDTDHVAAIREAMQGKTLDGDRLSGWRFIRPPRESLRPSAHVWAQLRSFVFARDDFTCSYCGARGVRLECDHVMPVSKGGSSEIENLTTACLPCNRAKRAKTIQEWFGVRS